MDDPGGPYRIGLALVFLMFSALFSSTETSLFATPKHLLGQLRTGRTGKKISHLMLHPEKTLSTILVGNTIANVAFTSTITAMILATTLPRQTAELWATTVSFGILLVLGEVLPKTVASHRPVDVLRMTAGSLYACSKALAPLAYVLNQANNYANVLLPPEGDTLSVASEDIISTALREGEQRGNISSEAGKAIRNIFETDSTPIRKVMTPRKRIIAVEHSHSISDVAQLMIRTGFSRIPVYEGRLDHLQGFIYMKDLLRPHDANVELSEVARSILKVDATDSVEKVLRQLRLRQIHMAAVYNSDKRLIGIVTIEDLLEEIVGEIVDEHDPIVAGDV